MSKGVPGFTTDVLESAKRACLSTAIVAYCRAFVRSSGTKFAVPILKLDIVEIGQEPWAQEMHQRLLDARHKVIAHADWEHHNSALIRPGPFRLGTGRIFSLPVLEAGFDFEAFKRLATTLHFQISIRRRELDERIIQHENRPSDY